MQKIIITKKLIYSSGIHLKSQATSCGVHKLSLKNITLLERNTFLCFGAHFNGQLVSRSHNYFITSFNYTLEQFFSVPYCIASVDTTTERSNINYTTLHSYSPSHWTCHTLCPFTINLLTPAQSKRLVLKNQWGQTGKFLWQWLFGGNMHKWQVKYSRIFIKTTITIIIMLRWALNKD